MGEFTAVAVGDRREDVLPVVAAAQCYLRNAREFPANDVPVRCRRGAERVEIHLLEEIHVFFRAFMPLRIACIIEAGIAGVPHNAPCRRREVHPRNDIAHIFSRCCLIDVGGTILAPSPGKGNGDILAIEGRNKKVDCRRSVLGENAGVEDHLFRGKIFRRVKRDKKGLLTRRLGLQGEQLAPVNNTVVRHCSPAVQEFQSLAQSIS